MSNVLRNRQDFGRDPDGEAEKTTRREACYIGVIIFF